MKIFYIYFDKNIIEKFATELWILLAFQNLQSQLNI